MDLLVVRIILAACLAVSLVGKVKDGRERFLVALRRFSVIDRRHETIVAGLLIVLETSAVVALLSPLYVIGSGLSVLLGLAFAWAVSTVLARGEHFPCHCFGSLFRIHVSVWLFGLDLLVVAAGVFLCVEYLDGGWLEPRILDFAVILSAIVVAGLAAQSARVGADKFRRRTGSPVGLSPGVEVSTLLAMDPDNMLASTNGLNHSSVVVLFMSADCPHCRPILDMMADLVDPYDRWRTLVAFREDAATVRMAIDELDLPEDRLHFGAGSLFRVFEIPGTPAAVLLADGIVEQTILPLSLRTFRNLCERLSRRALVVESHHES